MVSVASELTFDDLESGGTPRSNEKNEDDVSMIELPPEEKEKRPTTLRDMLREAT